MGDNQKRILKPNSIQLKYKVCDNYEVVVLSSSKAVELISDKYFIHNKIEIEY